MVSIAEAFASVCNRLLFAINLVTCFKNMQKLNFKPFEKCVLLRNDCLKVISCNKNIIFLSLSVENRSVRIRVRISP